MNLRPYRDADFDTVAEFFDEVSVDALGFVEQPREELRQWFASSHVDLERDVRLAFDGDRLVGYADVDEQGELWLCDVRCRPGVDPASVIPTLIGWIEERVGRGRLHVWAPSAVAGVRAAFEAEGFERIRSSYRMEIGLDGEVDAPVWPEGMAVRTLQPGEERAAYDVHQETFADSWEHQPEPYDEWYYWLVETESFDPSLWFLAWAGDGPAGAAICRVRNGIGWVGILGVRRPWRRRGLGRALLLEAFGEFRRRGLERAGLGVDAESLTGANRLYQSVGMRPVRQLDIFEKRLT